MADSAARPVKVFLFSELESRELLSVEALVSLKFAREGIFCGEFA